MLCRLSQLRNKTYPASRKNWLAGMRWKLAVSLSMCLAAVSGDASTWYVDSAASGANNGTSWANAWTSLNAVSGVKAGDVVYIGGGPSGSSRTYLMSGTWMPTGGIPGNPVTYQIAPDPAHNGTATFNGGGGGNTWLGAANNVVVSGDAGDGNKHFATVGYTMAVSGTGSQNIRISYINFGQMLFGILLNQASVFEADHCYLYKIDGTGAGAHDYAFSLSQTSPNTSAYDVNKLHDNVIYVPRGAYGYGDDCVQQTGNGLSMYNNTIVGYITSYGGNQHQDGIQTLTGSFLKIYNNSFINMGNSGVFLDGYYGGFTNVLVYNNVIYMNSPVPTAYYPRGMDIISDAAAVPGPLTFANIIVANNTVANYPTLYGIGFYAPATGVGSTYINDLVVNNICYNTTGTDIDNRAGLVSLDNSTVTASGSNFVSYLSLDAAPSGFQYDFHLAASDTTFRRQGTNLYQYFTSDKDGTSRSPTAAWDLGAYAYGGSAGPNLPPTVSAISQNAVDVDPNVSGVQVLEGTVVQYSASAADPNGDPLTWNWVYTVNGGPEITYQSGSGTVTPVNFAYATGTAGNTYLWALRVSDGQLTNQSQVTTSVEVPPQAGQGLTFLAASGTIAAPFATTSGYISQTIQTTSVTNGGRAAFNFTITNAGYYVVQTLVNAPTDAANSMYVNIDAEPQDPTMIWDMPLTAGFEQRLVSWRGTGTDTSDQYVPELFNLTQGPHQIIFRGKQANVQLQGFNILKVPQPPNGLQVTAGP